MRKLILLMHTSLDGFVASPKGGMNWISMDNEIFDFVDSLTDRADAALYGRVTYDMMQNYWPGAGKHPGASKHEINHSAWYSEVLKIVLSRTISVDGLDNTLVISNNLVDNISKIKAADGKDILILGSPTASRALLNEGLIDEFWLFISPIVIGDGLPAFKHINETTKLKLIESKAFNCGVIALHYEKI